MPANVTQIQLFSCSHQKISARFTVDRKKHSENYIMWTVNFVENHYFHSHSRSNITTRISSLSTSGWTAEVSVRIFTFSRETIASFVEGKNLIRNSYFFIVSVFVGWTPMGLEFGSAGNNSFQQLFLLNGEKESTAAVCWPPLIKLFPEFSPTSGLLTLA